MCEGLIGVLRLLDIGGVHRARSSLDMDTVDGLVFIEIHDGRGTKEEESKQDYPRYE
jgi:hypothetical protein